MKQKIWQIYSFVTKLEDGGMKMNKRIVVLGGSFNPPTIAHQKLMLTAVDTLNADMGIFVPSPHEYVCNKMINSDRLPDVLDEDLRLKMLWSMAEDDTRLSVDDYEYHLTERSRSYNTMVHLREKYPDAELFFVAGGDKLDILPRWYRIKDFLEQFRIIVTNREGYNAADTILEDKFLSSYKDRFVVIDYPVEIGHISSSAVRDMWSKGDFKGASEMLHPKVYEIMKNPTEYVIDVFRGEYYFLSNFYETPVTYNGLTYKNTEAAFQAQKCMTDEERIRFTGYDPATAKNAGRRVALRPDWEEVKVSLMEEIVRAKFTQNEDLREKLLATKDAILKEGNTWDDLFWGVSIKTGKGKNNLGKILMKIREELK